MSWLSLISWFSVIVISLVVFRFHSVYCFIISDCFLVVLLCTHHTMDQGDGGNQCDPYYIDGLKPRHCELVCNTLSFGFIEGYTSMCKMPTFKASHANKQTCSFLCQHIRNYICSTIENANTILCAIHVYNIICRHYFCAL